MIENIFSKFSDFTLNPRPENSVLETLTKTLLNPPLGYIEFITNFNGANGDIGEDFLSIWTIEETLEINEMSKKDESGFYETHWVFAGNTGIFQYVFEKETGKIFESDPYELDHKVFMGISFEEFIINLSQKKL